MNLLHQKGRMPILLDQNSQEYRLKSEKGESNTGTEEGGNKEVQKGE